MMVGLIGASIISGIAITRTGRYRLFPILGTLIVGAAMIAMTTLAASTPIWLICVFLFVFGTGLGLIMQVVVLVAQNSVAPSMIGTATSTNNYFREVGAALGTAVFGTIFTTRLTANLKDAFTSAGASAGDASNATATLDPQTLNALPKALRDLIVTAYADALAPVFWYLVPFIAIAFLLALILKQIPLSDEAGLVARGEAIGGAEAEALEAAQRGGVTAAVENAAVALGEPEPIPSAGRDDEPSLRP
jgi:MFS family permease